MAQAPSQEPVTRSPELRRIERAIQHENRAELEWALGQVELRKQWQGRSDLWYRLERRIRAALAATEVDS